MVQGDGEPEMSDDHWGPQPGTTISRLTRRGKAVRAAAIALAVVVGLSVAGAAGGIGLARAGWERIAAAFAPGPALPTMSVHAPAPVAGGPWRAISAPGAPARDHEYAVVPTDPATIYLCLGAFETPAGLAPAGPVELWRTQDGGSAWARLPLPATNPGTCALSVAPDEPRRLLVTSQTLDQGRLSSCAATTDRLSADGGLTWTTIAAPAPAEPVSPAVAGCVAWVTARHVYLYDADATLRDARGAPLGRLARSDDGGRTWVRADNGLDPAIDYHPTRTGDGDTLVVSAWPGAARGSVTTLWVTRDAGAHWRPIGGISTFVDIVLAADEPSVVSPSAVHPLYGLVGDQPPSGLYRLGALATTDGHTWSALPPLPVAGATTARTGLTAALGVDGAGRFLAFGVDPRVGVPAAAHTAPGDWTNGAQWLWIWDPRAARWSVLAAPLRRPWPEPCASLCWRGIVTPRTGPSAAGGEVLSVVSGTGGEQGLYQIALPRT